MQKVLIISYYFPPSGGAGVQRVLKFVKYLPEFGWEPVVLTVNESAGFPARDESLLKEIPGSVRIVRTPIFEPYEAYRKFTGKQANQGIDIATLNQAGHKSFAESASEWIRSTFFIPDARRFWKHAAVKAGRRIIREENIDVILSSAPPYTCHLIGMALSRRSGLPWIADFRDSWVDWLSAPTRMGLSRIIDLRLEGQVLRHADRILHVTDGIKPDLLSRHPECAGDKWVSLPNGFDGDDFTGVTGDPPKDRFTLTYTGSLYGHRNPETLLKAVDRLLRESPNLKDSLLLRFVGRADPAFLSEFKKYGSMIEHVPYVTHKESIRYLLNSHALLLIIDDAPASRFILTGKLYEYIGARRKILALAPEGEASALIQSLGMGKTVHPKDVEKCAEVLNQMIMNWKAETWALSDKSSNEVRAYDRKEQTKRLAEVMEFIK